MKFIGWTTIFVFVLTLCGSLLIFVKDGESGNHLWAVEKNPYSIELADGTVCYTFTTHIALGFPVASPHDATYRGNNPADGHPDGHWQWPVVVRTNPTTVYIISECPCDDSGGCDDS